MAMSDTPKRTAKEAWAALDALPKAAQRLAASELARVGLLNKLDAANATIGKMQQDLSAVVSQFEAESNKGFFARLFG